jgi:hypothetical protein
MVWHKDAKKTKVSFHDYGLIDLLCRTLQNSILGGRLKKGKCSMKGFNRDEDIN